MTPYRVEDWSEVPIQAPAYIDDEKLRYRTTIIKPGWIFLFILFMLMCNVGVWFIGWCTGHFSQTGLTSHSVEMKLEW